MGVFVIHARLCDWVTYFFVVKSTWRFLWLKTTHPVALAESFLLFRHLVNILKFLHCFLAVSGLRSWRNSARATKTDIVIGVKDQFTSSRSPTKTMLSLTADELV